MLHQRLHPCIVWTYVLLKNSVKVLECLAKLQRANFFCRLGLNEGVLKHLFMNARILCAFCISGLIFQPVVCLFGLVDFIEGELSHIPFIVNLS